jgi:hypothetical protein
MHARQQAAERVPLLVEIGRVGGGPGRARNRRGAEPARHAGRRIQHRIGIEVVPAAIVMADHVDHLVERIQRVEPVVAEGAREGAAQIVVLGHGADEPRLAGRRALNHHVGFSLGYWPNGSMVQIRRTGPRPHSATQSLYPRDGRVGARAVAIRASGSRSNSSLARDKVSNPCPCWRGTMATVSIKFDRSSLILGDAP